MARRRFSSLAAAFALVAALGLPVAAQDAPVGPPQATPIADPPAVPAGDGTGVRLLTDQGDIVVGLFTESSPVAAENFLNLVNAGYYDGLTFHRLVPGVVVQGGDPAGDGTGGPGYTIADEPVVGRYGRGIVAMARQSGVPNSQGSQFFVVLDDRARGSLEASNDYAIFGRVIEGMDVVDAIAEMPTADDGSDQALEPVRILKASVEQVTLPPEPVPGDPELAAMLPATVGDQPLQVESFNGAEIRAQFDPGDPSLAELEAILAAAGGTLDDLSVAGGAASSADGRTSVTAVRLRGADASALIGGLLPFMVGYDDPQQEAVQVGGKEVIAVTDAADVGSGGPTYARAVGDVLFVVQAAEPLLSEVFSQLP